MMCGNDPAACKQDAYSHTPTESQLHDSARLHFKQGMDASFRIRIAEMVDEFRVAVKLDPNFPEACMRLGYGLEELENLQENIACLREQLAVDPENRGNQYELSRLLWYLGMDTESTQLLNVIAGSNDRRSDTAQHLLDEYRQHGAESNLEWEYFPDDAEEEDAVELLTVESEEPQQQGMESLLDLEAFQQRLAEVIAWCRSTGPLNDPRRSLRSSALEPTTPLNQIADERAPYPYGSVEWRAADERVAAARWSVVEDIALRRAELLRKQGIEPAIESATTQGGRLIVYDPNYCRRDGIAEVESQGYFDEGDCPPWDTWLGFLNHTDLPPDYWEGQFRYIPGAQGTTDEAPFVFHWGKAYLVCWIPEEFLDLAAAGEWAVRGESLVWMRDVYTLLALKIRIGFFGEQYLPILEWM